MGLLPPGAGCGRLSQLVGELLGGVEPCRGMRLVGHCAAARILLRLGVEPPEGLLAAAVTEPGGGSSLRSPSTTLLVGESGGLLRGEKLFVTNGVDADVLVVYARSGEEPAVALVERNARGVEAEPMRLAAYGCSGIARILFRDAPARPLAVGREAYRAVVQGLADNRVLVAALAVGLGRMLLAEAAEWARARRVARHQAVGHRLARAWALLEAAASHVEKVAARLDAGEAGAVDTSAAKYVAVEAALEAYRAARRTLAGAAFSEQSRVLELGLHVEALEPAEGTQDIQLEIIARTLLR